MVTSLCAASGNQFVRVEAGPGLRALRTRGWWMSGALSAPKLMGERGVACSICQRSPVFPGAQLCIKDVRLVGQDIRITARIA